MNRKSCMPTLHVYVCNLVLVGSEFLVGDGINSRKYDQWATNTP